MNIRIKSHIILFYLIGLLIVPLHSQSINLDGLTIQQTVRWSGKITIQGDVVVAPTGILIIEPGTQILFAENTDKSKTGQDKTRSELIVQGVLLANGTSENKITFTSSASQPKMGDWYGISITGTREGSELDYVIVEYAYNGLTVKKNSPRISNSQIRYNFYSGLTIEIKSNPTLTGNIISENGYAGIICRLGSNPVLSDNIITLNQIGLIVFGNSSPNLGSLKKDKDYNIGRNTIVENQEYNIHNHSSQQIKAENNTWGSTDLQLVANLIYDSEDDAKYGNVDFNPVFRAQEHPERRFLGNQFSSTMAGSPANLQRDARNSLAEVSITQTNTNTAAGTIGSIPAPENTIQNNTSYPDVNIEITDIQPLQKKEESEITLAGNDLPETSEQPAETADQAPAVPQIDYEQVFLDVFLDEKKEILYRDVPNSRLKLGYPGEVIVKVVVNKDGLVESANVLKSLDYYFDELSLESAKKFMFKSGKINNQPVRFSTVLVFKF